MNVLTQSPQTLGDDSERHQSVAVSSSERLDLLQAILEGMPDGILIVSDDGKLIQSNTLGRCLCGKLIDRPTPVDAVPYLIWRLCTALLDSRETFADDPERMKRFMIEEDISTNEGAMVRTRVQWFDQDTNDSRILVVLEDRYQVARNRAIAEGQRYGLTDRESEIWLYRCIGHTYKQIASQLFITVDTVKKHVKSINAKRETFRYFSDVE